MHTLKWLYQYNQNIGPTNFNKINAMKTMFTNCHCNLSCFDLLIFRKTFDVVDGDGGICCRLLPPKFRQKHLLLSTRQKVAECSWKFHYMSTLNKQAFVCKLYVDWKSLKIILKPLYKPSPWCILNTWSTSWAYWCSYGSKYYCFTKDKSDRMILSIGHTLLVVSTIYQLKLIYIA